MAIASADNIIAGAKPPQFFFKAASGTLVAGRPFSPFYTNGIPGPAVAPSPGVAGAALTSYLGQIPFANPGSGNTHLARFAGSATQAGVLMLCDRLWHNSGLSVTSTASQAVNSVAWPARDINASTNGEGVLVGMEVVTATGGGSNVPTLGYTDSDGNAGATAGLTVAYSASSAIGTFYPFNLAAGDKGVRTIQTFQNSVSMTSGSIALVTYRVLAQIDISTAGGAAGPFELGLPRLYDDTVPFLLFVPSASTSSLVVGTVTVTQG